MKEALRDDAVSKMIDDLNGRHILGEFNQNQIIEILKSSFDMR